MPSLSLGNETLTLTCNQAHSANAISSLDDDVSRFITSVSPQAICINGRFGDVFKGTHKTMGEVALKRLRIGSAAHDEQVIRVRFSTSILRLGNLYYSSVSRERQIHGGVWDIPMFSSFLEHTNPRAIFTLSVRSCKTEPCWSMPMSIPMSIASDW